MPDFSRPEYASYVQLCRELRLKREFRDGDWFWWSGDRVFYDALTQQDGIARIWSHEDDAGVYAYSGIAQGEGVQPDLERRHATNHATWLPTLADWLEMLEATGMEAVTLERINHVWYARGFNDRGYGGALGAPTREEAAARLYVAITQIPAAPEPPSAAR